MDSMVKLFRFVRATLFLYRQHSSFTCFEMATAGGSRITRHLMIISKFVNFHLLQARERPCVFLIFALGTGYLRAKDNCFNAMD